MHLFQGENCRSAWLNVADAILNSAEPLENVLVRIEDPIATEPPWYLAHCPSKVDAGATRLRDVANTIFPEAQLQRFASRSEFYEHFSRAYSRGFGFQRNRNAWGTYYQRLTSYGESELNQLERAVECMKRWKVHPQTAFYFHLSDPVKDTPRPLGAPCLQYVQVLDRSTRGFTLVAVYRNHDYARKALGNFLGLGRLAHFICEATNRHCDSLVCHSIRAYSGITKTKLRELTAI